MSETSNEIHAITGATGALGSHIAEQLVQQGKRVRALVRPTSDTEFLRSLGVELFVGDLNDPSARLRVTGLLPYLNDMGLSAEAREIPRHTSGRFSFFRGLRSFEIVVIHRKLFGLMELAFLRRNAATLVYDFDDALPYRVPWRGATRSWKRLGRFKRTLRWADGCVVGSPYLLDLAGPRPERALILPTAVELDAFDGQDRSPGQGFVMGWIGQKSSLPYLEGIAPALEAVGQALPQAELHVVADATVEIKGLKVKAVDWALETEAQSLSEVHVGLAPLTDDAWSRGKCGFKVLQYFAAAKPVVASPVGVNADLVEEGKTGFHARTTDDWVEALGNLAADPDLRARMGAAGSAMVESGYGREQTAERLADFLKTLPRK